MKPLTRYGRGNIIHDPERMRRCREDINGQSEKWRRATQKAMQNRMRTYVYVDGFNLYYGALKGTRYKWLDIDALVRLILPKNNIQRIKYFTAIVNARPNDPDQPNRQQAFLRALRTYSHVEVILGQFLVNECYMPEAGYQPPRFVKVLKTEEKGSDVNIAAHLLMDGFKGLYDVAVLVTNDSDLREPVRMVTQELGLKVGILNPHKKASRMLNQYATFTRTIRKAALRKCQFPSTLQDAMGVITKPASW